MINSPIDTELIKGCIKNDRLAQERLYKQYYGPMLSICIKYTRNESDAVEVLNNAFLKVFRNIHLYDYTKAGLFTWIRTIMVNSAIDFVRQYHKHAPATALEVTGELFIDSDVLQKLDAGELLHLVRQLPRATQTVFNMYVMEGYTHKEIGIRLGISEGTSKWHLSEARKALQKCLKLISVA